MGVCSNMKKKILFIFSMIILFIGGYFLVDEYNKRQLVQDAQEKAEEFILQNYEGIETVEINPDNYHFDPMEGLSIGGKVNNNDDLYFHVLFMIHHNEIRDVHSIVTAPNFPSKKEDCVNDFCQ